MLHENVRKCIYGTNTHTIYTTAVMSQEILSYYCYGPDLLFFFTPFFLQLLWTVVFLLKKKGGGDCPRKLLFCSPIEHTVLALTFLAQPITCRDVVNMTSTSTAKLCFNSTLMWSWTHDLLDSRLVNPWPTRQQASMLVNTLLWFPKLAVTNLFFLLFVRYTWTQLAC